MEFVKYFKIKNLNKLDSIVILTSIIIENKAICEILIFEKNNQLNYLNHLMSVNIDIIPSIKDSEDFIKDALLLEIKKEENLTQCNLIIENLDNLLNFSERDCIELLIDLKLDKWISTTTNSSLLKKTISKYQI